MTEIVRQRKPKAFELAMEKSKFGVIVCNKAERGLLHDRVVAHIMPRGDLCWYVKPGYTPVRDAIRIRQEANTMANEYKAWADGLRGAELQEYGEIGRKAGPVWSGNAYRYKINLLCRCLDMDRGRLLSLHRGFQKWAKRNGKTQFPIWEHRAQIRTFLGDCVERNRETLYLFCSQEQAARKCSDLDCAWCPINNAYMALPDSKGEN